MFIYFCKICGISRDADSSQFFPLYNSEEETKRLTTVGSMFFQCIFKTLIPNTQHPAYLCEGCKLRLIEFHKFRQLAIKTHETIVELLGNKQFLKSLNQEKSCPPKRILEGRYSKTQNISEPSSNKFTKVTIDSNPGNQSSEASIFPRHSMAKKTYPCPICKKLFKNSLSLFSHKKIHLRTSESTICNICGKQLSNVHTLKVHEFRHTGLRPWKCDLCGKSYKSMADLQTHKTMHFKIRKFICDICGLALRIKSHLIDHMESHSTEQFYQCQHCSLKLKTKKTLVQHIEISHLNAGRFICLYCNAAFGGKQRLLRHVRIHVRKGEIKKEEVLQYAKMEEPILSSFRNRSNLMEVYGENDKAPQEYNKLYKNQRI